PGDDEQDEKSGPDPFRGPLPALERLVLFDVQAHAHLRARRPDWSAAATRRPGPGRDRTTGSRRRTLLAGGVGRAARRSRSGTPGRRRAGCDTVCGVKVLLPDNVPLNPTVPDGVTTVSYDVTRPVPDEHLDAEVLVAWANAPSTLEGVEGRLPNLRWVQSLAAGTDAIVSAGFAEDVVITSRAGLHDATVTEHALALTLAQVRRLPQMAAAQKERRWDRDLGGPQPLRPEGAVTSLIGAQVLVWGFGNIGQTLAPLLSGLGATVRGVARSAGTRAGFDVIAEEDIESALPQT